MAKKAANQDLAYIKILGELRKLINTEYKDGGRLPSSREMCERMQANRNTNSKAMARLIIDGYARNYHQKGIFITPDRFRCHKIGIVLSNGADSPFLIKPDQVAGAINDIHNAKFQVQLIQAVFPDQIYRKAIFHGVNSLLWFYWPANTSETFAIAKQIHESGELPVVMVEIGDTNVASDLNYPFPHVACDYQELGRKRAQFFIERKHKSIAFVGSSWFGHFTGFFKHLKKAGIKVNHQLAMENVEQEADKLKDYIIRKKVTAVFSEGPVELMHQVLEVVSDLSGEIESPEVINRDTAFSEEVIKDFPELKAKIGVEYTEPELARSAVSMLLHHLKDGAKLHNIKAPLNYKIKI